MEKVSEMTSANLWNTLINQQTWGGVMVNVKTKGAKGDGVTDDTAAIQAAIDYAKASGINSVSFPVGVYVTTGTITAQTASNQTPISLIGLSGKGSFFNQNNIVKIKRQTGTNHRMLYAAGHGLQIKNITFDGNAAIGEGIVIERGFELVLDHVRVTNNKGYGYYLANLSNAHINACHSDLCGYDDGTTYYPAVIITGKDVAGVNEKISNTVEVYNMHIERSRATALNAGYGTGTFDGCEFIKFFGLHVEQTIDNTDMSTFTTRPAVHVGNTRGTEFHGSFIYGGRGDLIRVEKKHDISTSGTSVDFFGGSVMGHISGGAIGPGAPDTLIHLVGGDACGFYGVRTNTAVNEHLRIESTFGAEVDHLTIKFNFERGTAVDIVDSRTGIINGTRTGINSRIVNNKWSHTNDNASFSVSSDGTPKAASLNGKSFDITGCRSLALPLIDDGVTPTPNSTLYIQSTTGKLTFKDAGGANHALF